MEKFVLLWIYLAFLGLAKAGNTTDRTSLHNQLINGYDVTVYPNTNYTVPKEVNVTFEMLELRDLEIKMSRFCITGSMRIEWSDDRLSWNPSSFNDIRSTRLPISKVWTPPIVLSNSYAGIMMLSNLADVMISYDGTVVWMPRGAFETTCDADITYFPFDSQLCTIKFAIFGYDMSDMLMQPTEGMEETEKTLSILNSMWDVKKQTTKVTCVGLDQTYEISYHFDRRYMFHLVGIVLPMLLISMLGLCTFAIPLDAGERIAFSTTILLTNAVFIVTVSDLLPESSYPQVALICFLIMAQMMLSVLILISVIVGARLHMREENVPVTAMWRLFVTWNSKRNKVGDSKIIKDYEGGKKIADDVDDDDDFNLTWKDVSLKYEKWCLAIFVVMTCMVNFLFVPIMALLG